VFAVALPIILKLCSGIANYFEADPTLIRLLFIIAVFGFGTGVLLYIILAIIMPEK